MKKKFKKKKKTKVRYGGPGKSARLTYFIRAHAQAFPGKQARFGL
jgi:hypothetical protein